MCHLFYLCVRTQVYIAFYRLEQNGEYERAAATALFNNQMRLAINILSGRNIREIKSDNGPREQAPPPGTTRLFSVHLNKTKLRSPFRVQIGNVVK